MMKMGMMVVVGRLVEGLRDRERHGSSAVRRFRENLSSSNTRERKDEV